MKIPPSPAHHPGPPLAHRLWDHSREGDTITYSKNALAALAARPGSSPGPQAASSSHVTPASRMLPASFTTASSCCLPAGHHRLCENLNEMRRKHCSAAEGSTGTPGLRQQRPEGAMRGCGMWCVQMCVVCALVCVHVCVTLGSARASAH